VGRLAKGVGLVLCTWTLNILGRGLLDRGERDLVALRTRRTPFVKRVRTNPLPSSAYWKKTPGRACQPVGDAKKGLGLRAMTSQIGRNLPPGAREKRRGPRRHEETLSAAIRGEEKRRDRRRTILKKNCKKGASGRGDRRACIGLAELSL